MEQPDVFPSKPVAKETWRFDRVYGPDLENKRVTPGLMAHVKRVSKGHNAAIFADGQSGSGKSFTMTEGPDCVMLTATNMLLQKALESAGRCAVWCGFLEFYSKGTGMVGIRDLLQNRPPKEQPLVTIARECSPEEDCPGKVTQGSFASGQKSKRILSMMDMNEALQAARERRQIAKGSENAVSSRGDLLCTITFILFDHARLKKRISYLQIADIASSESRPDSPRPSISFDKALFNEQYKVIKAEELREQERIATSRRRKSYYKTIKNWTNVNWPHSEVGGSLPRCSLLQ